QLPAGVRLECAARAMASCDLRSGDGAAPPWRYHPCGWLGRHPPRGERRAPRPCDRSDRHQRLGQGSRPLRARHRRALSALLRGARGGEAERSAYHGERMNEARLFGRVWRVLVGYDDESGPQRTVLDVSQLDIEFDVATDITRAPNKATIKIWNLGAEKRASLVAALADKRRRAVVSLEAGYEDQGASQIFRGEITAIRSGRGNVSTSIDIEARDSSEILRSARISQSFAPGTSVESVVRAAASALGAGEGNLSAYASGLTVDGERSFRSGYAASGLASSVLDDLLRAAGLRWSIQKGALQIRRAGG